VLTELSDTERVDIAAGLIRLNPKWAELAHCLRKRFFDRALGSWQVIRMTIPMATPASEEAASSGGGFSDMAKARALVQHLHAAGRRSTAELLHELRRAFPDAPLAVRVGALQALSGL
jgi:hypothetical protein